MPRNVIHGQRRTRSRPKTTHVHLKDRLVETFGLSRRDRASHLPNGLPKDNLTKDQRRAVKELRWMDDTVILPADKGNGTILMTKEDYNTKTKGLLETDTYRRLGKDPTPLRRTG